MMAVLSGGGPNRAESFLNVRLGVINSSHKITVFPACIRLFLPFDQGTTQEQAMHGGTVEV